MRFLLRPSNELYRRVFCRSNPYRWSVRRASLLQVNPSQPPGANLQPGGPPQTPNDFSQAGGGEGERGRVAEVGGGKEWWIFPFKPLLDYSWSLLEGSVSYISWYKYNILRKIWNAFEKGWDPVLELANASRPITHEEDTFHFRREEEELIERIMNGKAVGNYFLMLGPKALKGVGKTSLLIDAMRKNQADGVAVCEAHEDPEVFRLRLGKALDFEFYEDSINGLFQRRDPREAGPILDIERALNKARKGCHKIPKAERPSARSHFQQHPLSTPHGQGRAILHLLQQKAESWAQAGVVTFIFNSDDSWPFDMLKKTAHRMRVISVTDLDYSSTMTLIKKNRKKHFNEDLSDADAERIWDLIGGRPSKLAQVLSRRNMLAAAEAMVQFEADWLNAKLGLIPDHDDDVMDEQKLSSSSFLLFQELVKRADEAEKAALEEGRRIDGQQCGSIAYGEARVVMTRADFLPILDRDCIITIDENHNVRADGRLILNAMRKLVYKDNFQEHLNNVRERVDEIESLHRTAELTWKDKSIMRIRVARDDDRLC
ncbi:hypothetical protein BT69DRAFT_1338535 [Atractiella rhizophila]|nr:hypothetical protein BT69DRAFT_1338535 [Atractiella rhizophila]